MHRILLFLSLCASLVAARGTKAALSYQFTADVTYDPAGTRATAIIYLNETATAPDASRLLAEMGLFSAGVRIERDAASSAALEVSNAVAAPAFNDTTSFSSQIGAGFAHFTAAIAAPPFVGPTGSAITPETRRVPLGQFEFSLSPSGAGSAIYRIIDRPGTEDTLTNAGTVLDGQIQQGSFTVVVPEPAGAAGCAAAWAALLAWRSRRRGRRRCFTH